MNPSDSSGNDAAPAQIVRWHEFAGSSALTKAAHDQVLDAATRAIAAHGAFSIVLAGGNTPRALYESLRSASTDWSRWNIWFGDERCAAADDPQRNSAMAAAAWLDHVAISEDRLHIIPAQLGAEAAARSYSEALRGEDDFDLVLLGLGEDGHTASLFPGHDWGTQSAAQDALPIVDAPKPPPQRVSMSASRLSRASQVIFLVEGKSKAQALQRWRAHEDLPAAAIRPRSGVDVLVAT